MRSTRHLLYQLTRVVITMWPQVAKVLSLRQTNSFYCTRPCGRPLPCFPAQSLLLGTGHNYREVGALKREVGQIKFYPYKKGSEKVLAMLKIGGEGGHNNF